MSLVTSFHQEGSAVASSPCKESRAQFSFRPPLQAPTWAARPGDEPRRGSLSEVARTAPTELVCVCVGGGAVGVLSMGSGGT